MERKFSKLTPTTDVELGVYKDAIDYVFSNDDVKNVAISGAYGAGKSSVLSSYEKTNSDKKFLHISLAHFKSEENEDKEKRRTFLEGKILNQLIHQIPSEKIPQTDFKVKKKTTTVQVLRYTLATILLIASILYLSLFNLLCGFVDALSTPWLKCVFYLATLSETRIVSGFLIFAIISIFIYKIIRKQTNKNMFKKLNFQGNEIEIFEEDKESYFDKYLNEVLYLFENAEVDVIVFEDIDRFDDLIIFERLREINNLANGFLAKQSQKKTLRFFYLLKDCMFKSKDRTKFFDYIIPIVPVIDGSNSYDKFIEILNEKKILEKFDEKFLQDISLYIDDMRLLKNISNEFVVYFEKLNNIELDYNKMLSIISYKNLFPKDFSDLQLGKGFVFALFAKKPEIIQDETESIDKRISEIDNILSDMKKEFLKSEKELKDAFDAKRNRYSNSLSSEDQKEYEQRKIAIQHIVDGKKAEIEKEKAELLIKKRRVSSLPIRSLLNKDNIDDVFFETTGVQDGKSISYEDVKHNDYFDLLKFLIRNGYIDESYPDYMTYFYQNSLSIEDKLFLRSITDEKAKEWSFGLKDPAKVISRLRVSDFEKIEALNFQLTFFLLDNAAKYAKFIEGLFCELKKAKNYRFISELLIVASDTQKFQLVQQLCKHWETIFSEIVEGGVIIEKQVKELSLFVLFLGNKKDIMAFNIDNCLTNYISKTSDYLNIPTPTIEKFIDSLNLLNVKFISIDYDLSNPELYRTVFENCAYIVSFENINLILQKIFKYDEEYDIESKNYSLIVETNNNIFIDYVEANINDYIIEILNNCNGVINDVESASLRLINNDTIDIDNRKKYISVLKTKIGRIESITDKSLWKHSIDNEIILFSEHNIIEYFIQIKKIDDSLITFINGTSSKIDFKNIESEYDEKIKESLFNKCVVANEISDEKYQQIISTLQYHYNSFNIPNINDNKMEILVDCDVVTMNVENLQYIRDNYKEILHYFIRSNLEKYVEIIDNYSLSHEETLEILNWEISDDLKIELLSKDDNLISIIDKKYSVPVCIHILNNNLKVGDIKEIYSTYEKWNEEIKAFVVKYAMRNMNTVLETPNVALAFVKDILKENLEFKHKVDIIVSIISRVDKKEIQSLLQMLGLLEYLEIFDTTKRPTYEINSINKKLLEAFKEKGWIFSYKESSNRTGFYSIRRTALKQ